MTHRRRLLLLPLVGLLAAGCGSSQHLTPAQSKLVAEADPICASASARRAQANARLHGVTSLSNPQTLQVLASTASGVAAYESAAVTKLRKLSAPPSYAKEWQTMLTGLQQLANDTAQLGVYAKAKNVAAAERLDDGTQSVRSQLLAIASRDGFKSCGRND